jgi:hypothetical protein
MKQYSILIAFLLFAFTSALAQIPTQTIKGQVTDKQSQTTLPGVSVVLLNSNPVIGAVTDIDGNFIIKNVPIGRVTLQFTFLGYNTVTINNIILNAGKELITNVGMEEKVNNLNEVTVSAKNIDKKNALNEMATVSARSFTIEETNRYAGSLGDPSRMASNYAGVNIAGDSRNDIVIRGNSPAGLLWRLDGINIPNPNHFGALGTTGGPVSMLNNNLLDNSDFMTGAFPAEYGNALSGAFDLKMRSGNNSKHEFLGQVGFNGFELGAEGPLTKNKGSYLASYRYSTLGLLQDMGLNIGYGATPQYQDLSFKIDLPMGLKSGRFTMFGIGGKSYIELLDKYKKEDDFTVSGIAEDTYFGSDMGVIGLSHKLFLKENTSQTISLALSGVQNNSKVDSLINEKTDKIRRYAGRSAETKYSFNYNINSKINSKNTVNAGLMADLYQFNYQDSLLEQKTFYHHLRDFTGDGMLIQAYLKWQHRFSDNLTLNSGVHYQQFMVNNTYAVEPRIGLKYNLTEKQSLSIGTGLHSQLQPMSTYFLQTDYNDGSTAKTNEELEMSKSAHFVLGYDNNLSTNWRFKSEVYYQYLFNIPVESHASTFSLLNAGADYILPLNDSLVNDGTGKNYGIEITLEKFFSNNYYFLFTGSVYDAKYEGSDKVTRNTAFNGNYTFNLLGGAEFNLDKDKKKLITINGKVTYAGGKRYIPIDLSASQNSNQTEYFYNRAYEDQYKDYFRIDVKFGFKLNGKKMTQEWAFDLQNILNRKNIFQQVYNPVKRNIQTEYQLGLFPMMTYRINF